MTASALGVLLAIAVPASADVVVNISKSQQRLSVVVDGEELYRWPVSTGRPGYETPDGVFHAKSMNKEWYSRQYDMTPMPWSVFFYQGYALHGTLEDRHLGRAVSHGCVRLDAENAETLFTLVREQGLDNTKVVITDRPLPRPRKMAPMAEPRAPAKEVRQAEAPPAAKADRADAVLAVKTNRDDITQSIAGAKRDDKQQPAVVVERADKADRDNQGPTVAKAHDDAAPQPAEPAEPAKPDASLTASAPPAPQTSEPAPQQAKLAQAAPPVIPLPEPAPAATRQPAPVAHDAKAVAPAKAEAPPAEPAPREPKLAQAAAPVIAPPESPPLDARQPEPVQHAAKLVEPAKAAAPPVTVDIVLPRPAPPRSPEPVQAKASRRVHGETRYSAARGDEAEVLRERAAWLRALAHKYGFNEW